MCRAGDVSGSVASGETHDFAEKAHVVLPLLLYVYG